MEGIDPPNPAIANWGYVTLDEFEKLAQSVRDLASTHEQHRESVRFIADLTSKSIDELCDLIERLDNKQNLQQQTVNSLINALNELLELSQNFQQRIKQLETAP
jgi:HAMP domain-containing protein